MLKNLTNKKKILLAFGSYLIFLILEILILKSINLLRNEEYAFDIVIFTFVSLVMVFLLRNFNSNSKNIQKMDERLLLIEKKSARDAFFGIILTGFNLIILEELTQLAIGSKLTLLTVFIVGSLIYLVSFNLRKNLE